MRFGSLPSTRYLESHTKLRDSRGSIRLRIDALLERGFLEKTADLALTQNERQDYISSKQRGYRIARRYSPAVIPWGTETMEDPSSEFVLLRLPSASIDARNQNLFVVTGKIQTDEFDLIDGSILICERRSVGKGELEVLPEESGWRIERRTSSYPSNSIFLRAIVTDPK